MSSVARAQQVRNANATPSEVKRQRGRRYKIISEAKRQRGRKYKTVSEAKR